MMVNSADFVLKNVFINRDLDFLPRCAINVIPLKVNKLKEYFDVNTLAKKYLFTFSGEKSGYKHRKPIKYIKLVQCYFFSSTNNSQDRFLSKCFGIEKSVKNLISKRNYSSLYVKTIRFSNHFLYIMNVVFRPICRREIFAINSIIHFYKHIGFKEVLKYRFFCIFDGKNETVEIVENPKKKVSNNQYIKKLVKSYQHYFCYINHGVTANHATFVLFRYLESYFFNDKSFYVTNRPLMSCSHMMNEISRSLCHLLKNHIHSMSYTYSGHILNVTIGRAFHFNDCSVMLIFYKNIICYNYLACWDYLIFIFNIRLPTPEFNSLMQLLSRF